ncbi:MAG: hypothetical protein AAF604_10045 [Acidobacteriota bacterium]
MTIEPTTGTSVIDGGSSVDTGGLDHASTVGGSTPDSSVVTDTYSAADEATLLASLPTPSAPPQEAGGVTAEEAAELVRQKSDPADKAAVLDAVLTASQDEPAWRQDVLRQLGGEEIGRALSSYSAERLTADPVGGRDVRRAIDLLSGAAEALPPAELDRLLGSAGADTIANILDYATDNLGRIDAPGLSDQLDGVARAFGALADSGAGSGQVQATLDRLMTADRPVTSPFLVDRPRAEVAGRLVAASGSESLKQQFVEQYLPAYRPGQEGSASSARAIAGVLGSMADPSALIERMASYESRLPVTMSHLQDSLALAPAEMRSFLHDALAVSDVPEYILGIDGVVQGNEWVNFQSQRADFLEAFATSPEVRADFRAMAFSEGAQRLAADGPEHWLGRHEVEDALARAFSSDVDRYLQQLGGERPPDTIISRLAGLGEADPDAGWADPARDERALSQFFGEVLHGRGESNATEVRQALERFIGVGAERDGLADHIAEAFSQGREWDRLAVRDLGFTLGATLRGGVDAIDDLKGIYDSEKEMFAVVGDVVDYAIGKFGKGTPAGTLYETIDSASGGRLGAGSVIEQLYDWMRGDDLKAQQGTIAEVGDDLLAGAARPFAENSVRQGDGAAPNENELLYMADLLEHDMRRGSGVVFFE